MIRLAKAIEAWGTADFTDVLKHEIEQLKADQLPLQQGLSCTSYVADSQHKAMIIRVSESKESIQVKAGIFYSGIIAGCSCADDPTPVDEQNEYCEMQFEINRQTAETSVTLLEN